MPFATASKRAAPRSVCAQAATQLPPAAASCQVLELAHHPTVLHRGRVCGRVRPAHRDVPVGGAVRDGREGCRVVAKGLARGASHRLCLRDSGTAVWRLGHIGLDWALSGVGSGLLVVCAVVAHPSPTRETGHTRRVTALTKYVMCVAVRTHRRACRFHVDASVQDFHDGRAIQPLAQENRDTAWRLAADAPSPRGGGRGAAVRGGAHQTKFSVEQTRHRTPSWGTRFAQASSGSPRGAFE